MSIRLLDSSINFCVFLFLLLLLSYGCYAIWDSEQIYAAGDAANYQVYKPSEESELSFKDLKDQNSDVLGWISVYGTKIDYPLLQGEDNQKYISMNAQGDYSLAGSIFLDYRNAPDFTDFNTIIFGHHMEKSAMFGDLERFFEQDFFEQHKYGNLYYQDKDHGIEFFAFMEVDAFDSSIYTTPVSQAQAKQKYLDSIKNQSKYYRAIDVSIEDYLVLLSTCTENTTNGRHILVGRVTDKVFPEPKEANQQVDKKEFFQSGTFLEKLKENAIIVCLFSLLVIALFILYLNKKRKLKKDGENE
ncbi:sortase B [Isobaculum melis]|uniref:Sortase B n=2 Tax=Isobaculum melis TaxID=142588 RepID=A0A1H9Q3L3_9LACT|nr:sortase B [Isobaculum melis]